LDTILSLLAILERSDHETFISFPRPYANYPELDDSVSASFNLPSVLVPPEVIELEGLSADSGEEPQVKKEEWPEHILLLFDDPACFTPSSI